MDELDASCDWVGDELCRTRIKVHAKQRICLKMRSQVGTSWKQVVNSLVIWPRICPKDLRRVCLQRCSFNYSCKKVLKERSPDNKATSNCLLDLVPLVALSSTSFTFQLLPPLFCVTVAIWRNGRRQKKKKMPSCSVEFRCKLFQRIIWWHRDNGSSSVEARSRNGKSQNKK